MSVGATEVGVLERLRCRRQRVSHNHTPPPLHPARRDSDGQRRAATKLHAHSGLFGQLPLIQANLSDCTVLIDPLSGNISSPFQLGSAIDARGLLSFYPDAYEAGSGARYFNESGCDGPMLAAWVTAPPYVPGSGWVRQRLRTPRWFCDDFYNWLPDGGGTACVCTYEEWVTPVVPGEAPIGQPLFLRRQVQCARAGSCWDSTLPAPPSQTVTPPPACPGGVAERWWQ